MSTKPREQPDVYVYVLRKNPFGAIFGRFIKSIEFPPRLAAGIDIKGGTDSLFFIEDPSFRRTEFCAISLCKSNRLRMVDCKDLCPSIEQVIQGCNSIA